MIKKYKRKTNINIGLGIFIMTVGLILLMTCNHLVESFIEFSEYLPPTMSNDRKALFAWEGIRKTISFISNICSFHIFIGTVLFIRGFWYYAKAKGYQGAWGLVALSAPLGIIALVLLKDKEKTQITLPTS